MIATNSLMDSSKMTTLSSNCESVTFTVFVFFFSCPWLWRSHCIVEAIVVLVMVGIVFGFVDDANVNWNDPRYKVCPQIPVMLLRRCLRQGTRRHCHVILLCSHWQSMSTLATLVCHLIRHALQGLRASNGFRRAPTTQCHPAHWHYR